MRNRKGSEPITIGSIVIFVIVALFVVIVITVDSSIQASTYKNFILNEKNSSVHLVRYAVINSPQCLLNVDTANPSGTQYFRSGGGIISWNQAKDIDLSCVRKWPYYWEMYVKDKDAGESITEKVSSDHSCGKDALGNSASLSDSSRWIPITIIRNDYIDPEIHDGYVAIMVKSADFGFTLKREKGTKFIATIKNTNNCKVTYYVEATVKNGTKVVEMGEKGGAIKTRIPPTGTISDYFVVDAGKSKEIIIEADNGKLQVFAYPSTPLLSDYKKYAGEVI